MIKKTRFLTTKSNDYLNVSVECVQPDCEAANLMHSGDVPVNSKAGKIIVGGCRATIRLYRATVRLYEAIIRSYKAILDYVGQ